MEAHHDRLWWTVGGITGTVGDPCRAPSAPEHADHREPVLQLVYRCTRLRRCVALSPIGLAGVGGEFQTAV